MKTKTTPITKTAKIRAIIDLSWNTISTMSAPKAYRACFKTDKLRSMFGFSTFESEFYAYRKNGGKAAPPFANDPPTPKATVKALAEEQLKALGKLALAEFEAFKVLRVAQHAYNQAQVEVKVALAQLGFPEELANAAAAIVKPKTKNTK